MTVACILAVGLSATHPAQAVGPALSPAPVSLREFRDLPRPAPSLQLSYGAAPSQGVDVFLPEGHGPFPVAVLIHGGCWRDLPGAGREQLRHLGAALAAEGVAVWSIGYRRADEAGGGYPGTFQDVAEALDLLTREGPKLGLDPAQAVLVGHSAGGHLALWAAARRGLRKDSALAREQPFAARAVVSLAGVGDLRAFGPLVPVLCGAGIFESLMGAESPSDDRLAEISPAQMPPPTVPVVLVSGVLDRLVPPYAADDYARAIGGRGASAPTMVEVAGAGHFDLLTLGTSAWSTVRRAILDALNAPVPADK